YFPDVIVFRASEKMQYQFLASPLMLAFIAAPAYNHPQLINSRLSDDYAARTSEKIAGILNVGAKCGHDAIVLSAFGCGAFANPPEHISQLFKHIILERFMHCYKRIEFAIIDDHNTGKDHNRSGNFQPFHDTFSDMV
nr:TIGR02452 family protein [Candidatus Sigynarchaeota archaeon]